MPACHPGIVKLKNLPDDQCKFGLWNRRTDGRLELDASIEEVNGDQTKGLSIILSEINNGN
jgi:hypothetical protein